MNHLLMRHTAMAGVARRTQPIGRGGVKRGATCAISGAHDPQIMMETDMNGLLHAAVAALALYGGVAAAQTASETTTTQSTSYPAVPPPAPLAAPPAGTLATIHTTRSVDANGNEVYQQKTTYQNSQGVAQDTKTVTTTVPPPPPPLTTTTTTTTQQTTEDPN